MNKFPFPEFDISKSFIAFKAFKAAGHSFLPGDLFDWKRLCITPRRVTQFWDLRLITNPSDEILQHLEEIAMKKGVVETVKEAQETGDSEAAALATMAVAAGIDLKEIEPEPEIKEPEVKQPEPVPVVEPGKKSKGK